MNKFVVLSVLVCVLAILISIFTQLLPIPMKAKFLSIHMAASYCDSPLLMHILSHTNGSNPRTLVNSKDQFGWTPLMYASYLQRNPECLAMIQHLTTQGAWIDQQDDDGMTALHHAVQSKSIEAVNTLIQLGASVNISNADGWSPISVAAYWGRLEEARLLMEAAQNQHVPVQALTRARDKRGRTPAMFAILNGHKEMVYALKMWDSKLQKQTTPLLDMCDHDGKNALTLVLSDPDWQPMLGRLETVKWLLSLDVSLDSRDRSGLSVLMHAVGSIKPGDKPSEEIAQLIAKNRPAEVQTPEFQKLLAENTVARKVLASHEV